MAPRVSVILPVFNGEATIERAVRSALAQTEPAFELIIIDDASTDRTASHIARLAALDKRIRVLCLPVNQGPSAARNAGLAVATGTWTATLDADDAYHPERLARLLALASDDVDMVSDNLLVQPEAGACYPLIPSRALPSPRALTLTEFMLGNAGEARDPLASYGFLQPMIRRSFLARGGLGYDPRIRFGEDFVFYVQCLRAGARWLATPEPLYTYHLSADSLSHRQRASDLRRIERLDDALLSDPALNRNAALVAAIRRHRTKTKRLQRYRAVTDALKRRRFRRAYALFNQDAQTRRLVMLEILSQLPTIIGKALRGGYPFAPARPSKSRRQNQRVLTGGSHT